MVGANGSVDAWLNRGGNGSGGWSALGQVAKGGTGATGDQVRFADVNGDRRSDYLVVAANGSVTAWLNNGGDGAGGWSSAGQIASGVGATGDQVRFGDVNGDGFADYLLLEPNGAVSAWVNKGGTGTVELVGGKRHRLGYGRAQQPGARLELPADGVPAGQ